MMNNFETGEDFTIRIAKMYLSGMSLREISLADDVNLSYISVRRYLKEKLPFVDSDLYLEVIEKMKGNIPKSIRDNEVKKRVLRAYFAIVNEDKTISEIAENESKLSGKKISESVIYRDLTLRLPKLSKVSPEIITPEMLCKLSEILKNHSLSNLGLDNNEES